MLKDAKGLDVAVIAAVLLKASTDWWEAKRQPSAARWLPTAVRRHELLHPGLHFALCPGR